MDTQIQNEVTFYRDSHVLITQSRFVADAKTYAMRNISSVQLFEIEAKRTAPAILGAVGLVISLATEARLTGLIMLIIGVALYFMIKNSYAVRISTNSGEANSIISKDKFYIQKIVNALNDAIVHRG